MTSRAGVGSIVTLWDMVDEVQIKYTLVNTNEANIRQQKISVQSPIGRALVNKEEGDEVNVTTPNGNKRFEIVKLVTIHDDVEA